MDERFRKCASRPFKKHIRFYWPILFVLAAIPISLVFGDSLTLPLLAGTLVAIVWYSWETRSLRIGQERDAEIRNHPWISIEDVRFRSDTEGAGLLGSEHIALFVKNNGVTPAHEILISGESSVDSGLHEDQIHFMDNSVGNLPPGNTREVDVATINLEEPGQKIRLDFQIKYKSFRGGGGRIGVSCILSKENDLYRWRWHPLGPYEFWLSTGEKFPAESLRPVERR